MQRLNVKKIELRPEPGPWVESKRIQPRWAGGATTSPAKGTDARYVLHPAILQQRSVLVPQENGKRNTNRKRKLRGRRRAVSADFSHRKDDKFRLWAAIFWAISAMLLKRKVLVALFGKGLAERATFRYVAQFF